MKRADSWGSHTALHTHCAVSHQRSHRGAGPLGKKCYRGLLRLMRRPLFHDGARFRLCLDNVRELSASTRGSALVFQGVGESHYKMLGRKKSWLLRHSLFPWSICSRIHRRGGTIGEGYQAANYGSRVNLAFCVSGLCRRAFSTRTQRQSKY